MFSMGAGPMFADREEAGRRLAEALAHLRGQDVVVLGIPRGGVEVAAVVARELGAPLDVVIPRKVGAPGNPELGIGAVAEDVEVLDEVIVLATPEPFYAVGQWYDSFPQVSDEQVIEMLRSGASGS